MKILYEIIMQHNQEGGGCGYTDHGGGGKLSPYRGKIKRVAMAEWKWQKQQSCVQSEIWM